MTRAAVLAVALAAACAPDEYTGDAAAPPSGLPVQLALEVGQEGFAVLRFEVLATVGIMDVCAFDVARLGLLELDTGLGRLGTENQGVSCIGHEQIASLRPGAYELHLVPLDGAAPVAIVRLYPGSDPAVIEAQ